MTSNTRVVVIDTDPVVVACGCGVRPCAGLAPDAGPAAHEDVLVDGEPRTCAPHIHASGETEARPGDDVVPLADATRGTFTDDGGS